jgi:hypothetical protein
VSKIDSMRFMPLLTSVGKLFYMTLKVVFKSVIGKRDTACQNVNHNRFNIIVYNLTLIAFAKFTDILTQAILRLYCIFGIMLY